MDGNPGELVLQLGTEGGRCYVVPDDKEKPRCYLVIAEPSAFVQPWAEPSALVQRPSVIEELRADLERERRRRERRPDPRMTGQQIAAAILAWVPGGTWRDAA